MQHRAWLSGPPTFATLLALALVSAPSDGAACATVTSLPGETLPVVEDESAVVVWDSTSHLEDFVRTATFDASTERFAFVVPTPTVPTLSEVDVAVIEEAARLLTPRVRWETDYDVQFSLLAGGRTVKSKVRGADVELAGLPAVVELSHEHVAGMDATVVSSTDGTALATWLDGHGFSMRPALERWVTAYVARGYFFTVFQYVRPAEGVVITTRAVRMRFATDRAFFPYAEPDDAPAEGSRPFRLTVLADQPLRGTVGARTIAGDELLRRDLTPTRLVDDGFPSDWLGHYTLEGRAPARWATVLREDASVRGGDDLFFEPDPGAADDVPEEVRTRVERVLIPLDCITVLALVAGSLYFVVRRRRGPEADAKA